MAPRPGAANSTGSRVAEALLLGAPWLAGGLLLLLAARALADTAWIDAAALAVALLAVLAASLATARGASAARADRTARATMARERDVARAAVEAKSRYLAAVSHEIRSPLNAIYGYAQLLERGSSIDPRDAARVIARSAEHLTDLAEGLLDISLVEHGVLRVSRDTVRLRELVEQVAGMFRPAAQAKGVTLDCVFTGAVPDCVRTDATRLRQILINLLSNAVKFTPSGAVELRLRHTGEVAVIEVRDSGPGIAPDRQEAIFAPFASEGESGVGLGLPITRALVRILGGSLDLESTPGVGSCFRLQLHLPRVAAPTAGTVASRRAGYEGQRRAVLAVDDDPRQLTVVRGALEEAGFDVVTAPDGATALALFPTRAFDLVLLDVALDGPGVGADSGAGSGAGAMTGWDIARHLRETGGLGLRIVMLSGNAHQRQGPGDGSAPHDLFLVKPVALDALLDAVGTQLGLVWSQGTGIEGTQDNDEAPLPDAARAAIGQLRDMVRLGHVRGIEAGIRAVADAAPQAGALVAELYGFLDRFDLAGLGRRIEGL